MKGTLMAIYLVSDTLNEGNKFMAHTGKETAKASETESSNRRIEKLLVSIQQCIRRLERHTEPLRQVTLREIGNIACALFDGLLHYAAQNSQTFSEKDRRNLQ